MQRMCLSAILPILACLFSACDSGGDEATAQDFEVMGLDVPTPSPRSGHEIEVIVDLLAAEADDHVGLVFFVASRADVDALVAEPDLELVDAEALASVHAGRHLYEIRLGLPATLPTGEYYLIGVVDPVGHIGETDDEDNGPTGDEISSLGVPISIDNTSVGLTDLALESIHVDDVVVEVDVTPDAHAPVEGIVDTPNHHFGITATVRSSGPGALPNVALLAELEVPGIGFFPLQVWDPVTGTYGNSVAIPVLIPTEPTAIHLDMHLPQVVRDWLATLLPATLTGAEEEEQLVTIDARVYVHLDPFNAHDEFEAGIALIGDEDGTDNREVASLLLQIYEDEDLEAQLAGAAPENKLDWEVPYIKTFSNGNIGVAVQFHANANVDTKGVRGEANASVPVTLAGHTADLINLSAIGRYNPLDDAETGFVVTLKALNQKLYEKRTAKDETLNPADPLSYSKEVSFSATFFAGPVPMNVKAGARGQIGLDVGATAGTTFEVAAEPYLRFSAFVEGGVGGSIAVCSLTAGVGAEIPLIEDRFHAGITAGVSWDSVNRILTGSVTELVSNRISGPAGRVYVFVDGSCGWGWASYSKRWEYTLVTWSAFVRNDTLFNKTQSVEVHIP